MDVVTSTGVYRQHLANYTGKAIVHCHWSSHEDLGCMSQLTITTCETDNPAIGVLGTCSTHEKLGPESWTLALCVLAIVMCTLIFFCAFWWRRRASLPLAPTLHKENEEGEENKE